MGDPNFFEFNIDEYIIKNSVIPNYLECDRSQIPELVDAENDFYLKTKAIYEGEQENDGTLFLRKENLIWRSTPKIGMGHINKLKKLDSEIWEDEIKRIEK
jgi:hypothetical protein